MGQRLFAGTPWDQKPHCDRCAQPLERCQCPSLAQEKKLVSPDKQTARLAVEKRKRGKLVTIIRGLAAKENDLATLFSQLKQACGAGGSLAEGEIEIQGDHLARLRELLEQRGYRVKG